MYRIPFNQEKGFIPKTIIGNETADSPVTFDFDQPAGANIARLKSLLVASLRLSSGGWTPESRAICIVALEDCGGPLFSDCVTKISGLSAPANLCRKVGVVVPEKAADDDAVPIETGAQFGRVAPYMLELALEIGLRLQLLVTKRPAQDGVLPKA